MSEDYNSQLIAKLYTAKDWGEMETILEEMGEIKSAVFVWPIWEIYKKNRIKSFSHYFIVILGEIDSNNSLNFLKTIVFDETEKENNRVYAIGILGWKKEYYNPEINKIAIRLLRKMFYEEMVKEEKEPNYDMDTLFAYLHNANAISECQDLLQKIFRGEEFHIINRKSALSYLIRINSSEYIQSFIKDYENIKGKMSEIILAKEIVKWSGGIADELKNTVINQGSDRAREIIESKMKEDKKKREKIIKKEAADFSNAKLIKEISKIKRKINSIAKENLEIESNLFPDTELLIDQAEVAQNRELLRNACVDLRSCIQNISSPEHNIEEEVALKQIPGSSSEDLNKSINKLFLYLKSKSVKVYHDLFGLRDLNKIISLFGAHPDREEELKKILGKRGVLELYKNEKWSNIHRNILQLYKKSLEGLLDAITKKTIDDEKNHRFKNNR